MMKWEQMGSVSTIGVAHQVVAFGEILVLRGTQAVMGWNPQAEAFTWVHELPDDQLFGMKRLFRIGDEAVTIIDTGSGDARRVVWFEPGTGRVVRQVDCHLEPSQAGFVVADDIVFIHGMAPGRQSKCLRMDGRSGAILAEEDAPDGLELFALGGSVYMTAGSDGLFRTDVRGAGWNQIDFGAVTAAVGRGRRLFGFLVPSGSGSGWSLVCWDDVERKECGRVQMEVEQALLLAPADEPGLVAAYLDELGLWMMDVAAGRELWRIRPEDGWDAPSVVCTPGGIAIPTSRGQQRIEIRDLRTGQVHTEIPLAMGIVYYLFWVRDLLIVSSTRGLASFRLAGG